MYLVDFLFKTGFLIVLGCSIGLLAGLLLWYTDYSTTTPKKAMIAKQILWFGKVILVLGIVAAVFGVGMEFLPLQWLTFESSDRDGIKQIVALILMVLGTFLTIHPHFYDHYYSNKLR